MKSFMHRETSWLNIGVVAIMNWQLPPLPFPQGLARLARQAVWPLGDTLDDNGDQLGSSNFALQPSQVGARVLEEGGKTDVDSIWIRMCAVPS